MSLLDALKPRDTAAPDKSTHDNAHTTGVLEQSQVHLDAQRRNADAREAATLTTPDQPVPPHITVAELAGSFDYEVETHLLAPGEVKMIAGRDGYRRSIEVNNLSAERVQLAKTDKDARAPFPSTRSMSLPPNGTVPRKLSTTAPVFVTLDPNAGGNAEVDVIIERAKPPRP